MARSMTTSTHLTKLDMASLNARIDILHCVVGVRARRASGALLRLTSVLANQIHQVLAKGAFVFVPNRLNSLLELGRIGRGDLDAGRLYLLECFIVAFGDHFALFKLPLVRRCLDGRLM